MIYDKSFIELLEKTLAPVKETNDNIVVRCPICEYEKDDKSSHFHLWISKNTPVFRCFHADCGFRGHISKLLKCLEGMDTSKKHIIESEVSKFKDGKYSTPLKIQEKEITLPELDKEKFKLKELYTKFRTGYLDTYKIKGLVYDIEKFIVINNIQVSSKEANMLYFLHNNFIGFLTERNTCLVLRNINKSKFRYYKMILSKSQKPYIDYYKINCNCNSDSKDMVLAEGIFDVYSAYLNWKPNFNPRLFAAGFSADCYESLILALCFDEQLFKTNIHILSDSDISLDFYNKIKFKLKHLINSFSVYYNKLGHDFGSKNLFAEKLL
jgi:hypothetical protein